MFSDEKDKGVLRIGMMIRDIEELANWELRILKGIIEHPRLELALFIKDGRGKTFSFGSRFKRNILTPHAVANVLFKLQVKLESFLSKPALTVDKQELIDKTKGLETILMYPERKGYCDLFSDDESERVKAYNLDLIIRQEFNIIGGNILQAARYGIWSFHHADNAINRGGPCGFWEFANKEPCCGVTLQRLTPELDGGLVIDKAWYNISSRSFVKNRNELFEKSVSLLFINIDKLLAKNELETQKSLTYYNRLYMAPTLKPLWRYMASFYGHGLARLCRKLLPVGRENCWALFLGKGEFMETALFRLKPIPMPPGVFWADPFLFKHEGQLYVFFENCPYKTGRGKISYGRVVEEKKGRYSLADVGDALDFDYHLSYPYVVEEGGEIFLIPETENARRLEVYRAVEFPGKWELYATAFEGEKLVDATYFCDENGDRWLFVNKWPYEAYLYIYKIDSLKLGQIIGHKANPVIKDCRRARSGGAIFKYMNEYHRPSQVSTHGLYGHNMQISRIKKLTLDEYEEEPLITIEPNFRPGLVGIHHLHQINGAFVFDARFKKM
ncbi:MAG: hypothetical protein LBI54_06380 [Lachnospiraceae bacterium]|jgi:hypothetical protein|nr:hypothetical protein [Lachnospiraceae bacterium]